MSSIIYIASNAPIVERPNPHDKMVSVNEALKLGYESIPDYMLIDGFDRDKPGVLLVGDREVNFNLDTGIIEDGDFDDDFSVLVTEKVCGMRTSKECCAFFECFRLTTGRAEQFIKYIKEQLDKTGEIELWHIWLDDEPYHEICEKKIPVIELKTEDIFELEQEEVSKEPYVDYCYKVYNR